MRRLWLFFPIVRTLVTTLGLGALLFSSTALAGAPPKKAGHDARHTQARIEHHAPGKSVGSPTNGHLLGGAHLSEAPYLRVVPAYEGQDVRWGLEPLVGMIDRAARQVRRQYPESVMSVGHLSRRGGGEIDRHASHESGRDADIGFYVVNDQKKPVYEQHFVAFTADGKAPSWPGAHFDDARNWALVSALVSDPAARVTHIFVAAPLRTRLLAYAEKMGVSQPIRIRASEVLAQPHGALPHDDHFHVRIACPSHMQGCIEQPQAQKHTHLPDAHGRLASNAHPSAPAAHVAPAPAPHHGAPAKPNAPAHKDDDDTAPASAGDRDANHDEETGALPSLAPEVKGLDSVVIPSERKMPPAESHSLIDDVDGILER
jgi:penicillin-insensitive murein endopeptidase